MFVCVIEALFQTPLPAVPAAPRPPPMITPPSFPLITMCLMLWSSFFWQCFVHDASKFRTLLLLENVCLCHSSTVSNTIATSASSTKAAPNENAAHTAAGSVSCAVDISSVEAGVFDGVGVGWGPQLWDVLRDQLLDGLLEPEGGEAGRLILMPTLLHQTHKARSDLEEKKKPNMRRYFYVFLRVFVQRAKVHFLKHFVLSVNSCLRHF